MLTDSQVRIVVTHHPLDLPEGLDGVRVVGGAKQAMQTFARCGIDLFLAGHIHLVYFGSTDRYGIPGYAVPVMQAGTTISSRARGEPNSFFVHRIDRDEIRTETHQWNPGLGTFAVSDLRTFAREQTGWALRAP